jgi:HEPN domain-containing protein
MKETEREARRWYQQALDDLRFVEWVLQENRFFDKGCFVVQQAGEKALKSCLYGAGSRRVYGHSLFDACGELRAHSPSFAEVEEQAKRLDRFYIPTRYPNGLPGGLPFQSYSKRDLADALEDLRGVFHVCEAYLRQLGVDVA